MLFLFLTMSIPSLTFVISKTVGLKSPKIFLSPYFYCDCCKVLNIQHCLFWKKWKSTEFHFWYLPKVLYINIIFGSSFLNTLCFIFGIWFLDNTCWFLWVIADTVLKDQSCWYSETLFSTRHQTRISSMQGKCLKFCILLLATILIVES